MMPTFTPLTTDAALTLRPPRLGDAHEVRTSTPVRTDRVASSAASTSTVPARGGKRTGRLSAEDAIAVLEGRAPTAPVAVPFVEERFVDWGAPEGSFSVRAPQAVEVGHVNAPDAGAAVATTPAPASPTDLWLDPVPTFTALMGAAGSGKTFAARAWMDREPKGSLALCATTGIAAINLGGETINSTLGYFDTASLQEMYVNGFLTARLGKLWRSGVKRLLLDEMSMLSADQLTFIVKAIDEVNGKGYVLDSGDVDDQSGPVGMGLTLIGDFAQLSPVKATYACESPEWERFAQAGASITLTQIRRQADPAFIDALRAARVGDGKRALDYFGSVIGLQQETDDHFDGPTLLAKNDSVDRYNWLRMSRLPGREVAFTSSRWGKQRSEWGDPKKPPASWGIPQRLALKIGALVMVLANERTEDRQLIYVNGDLGEIVDVEEPPAAPVPQTDGAIPLPAPIGVALVRLQRTGQIVRVVPVGREVRIPCDSARRKELRAAGKDALIDGKYEIVGGITYMPLRPAYASTTHKSQGLSLDRVQVNIRDPFFKTPGMVYVALSRARTAGGLRLVGSPAAFIERCASDPRLKGFL